MNKGDCNLHPAQRKAGTLCRSMYCTKCPPYRNAKPGEEPEASKPKKEWVVRAEIEMKALDDIIKILKPLPDHSRVKVISFLKFDELFKE